MFHPSFSEITELFYRGLEIVETKHTYKFKDYSECIFDTQIQSKNWLVDELSECVDPSEVKRISVLASWYGIVAVPMLKRKFKHAIIDLYDIDEYTIDIAQFIFKHIDSVNVYCKDVVFHQLDLQGDVVINCSCEHMYDMKDLVNQYRGKVFALQSNDNRNVKWLHINCVDTPEELVEQADIKEILYKGSIQVHRNNRIMVIGK